MIKSSLFICALASAVSSVAVADVVAGWTMPTAVTAGTVGASYNYGQASEGINKDGSMLSGTHASATTAWSSPAGNGSQYAFSSNAWNVGDYYQISFSASGVSGVSVTWDQTRSSTGPAGFEAVLSTDGGSTFSSLGSYTIAQVAWSATTPSTTSTFSMAAGGADNKASAIIRFRVVTAGTSTTTGTNRIDNIMVNGSVPAPGAVALLGLAGLVSRRRR